MCECLCRKLPPMLVVKGKTKKSLHGYITTDAPEIRCGLSMIVLVLMRSWESNGLKTYFSPTAGTNVLTPHPWWAWVSWDAWSFRAQEGIHVLALPPHTTHFLQPLDRSLFGPFNKAYNKFCSDFLSKSALNIINKWTFPSLFKSAWEDGVTSENIVSGFRACGINPFNPLAIPNSAYLPSLASDVSQNTVTTSNISKSTITNTFLSLLKYSSCFTDRRCKHLLGICNPRKFVDVN